LKIRSVKSETCHC